MITQNALSQEETIPPTYPSLFRDSVSAGFPSPAQDFVERALDLNELCIDKPSTTYFVRATGSSMTGVGINDGDVLVVDRAINAVSGDTVIASVDGEFTVKTLNLKNGLSLEPANPDYSSITFGDDSEVMIFGVVTFSIHSLHRSKS